MPKPPGCRSRSRRGVTLIELMVVIFMTSLALGTVAILLRGALGTNSATQAHRAMVQSMQRLALQFREDVHGAQSIDANGDRLTLRFPGGGTVEYALAEGSVARTEPAGEGQTRREGFKLPAGATVQFAVDLGDSEPAGSDPGGSRTTGKLVSLAVEYPAGAEADPARRLFKIEAAHRTP